MHTIWIDKHHYSDVVIDATSLDFRIHEIRLLAALMEAGFGAKLSKQQVASFKHNPRYSAETFDGNFTELNIKINHQAPEVSLNNIRAPAIFPKWLIETNIPNKRIRYNFVGIQNRERVEEILRLYSSNKSLFWHILSLLKIPLTWRQNSFSIKVLNILTKQIANDDDYIIWSSGGRTLKNKLFDVDYFENLSASRFTICPAGDFPWSYRLIESVLHDAIPVYNHTDDVANKYKLKSLKTQEAPHEYDKDLVQYNKNQLLTKVVKYEELCELRKKLKSK